jgi:alcohol dehydrogenase YqhD (iron-dependent ADH family)
VLWAGSLAHNNLLSTGRVGDWASHGIEHAVSAYYDIAHGAGLAIVFPAWLKYVYRQDVRRVARFAEQVWGVDGAFYDPDQAALEGIRRMEDFFRSIGLPVTLADAKIPTDRIKEMAAHATKFPLGFFKKLTTGDVEAILKIAAN